MIIAQSIQNSDGDPNTLKVSLFADTKEEVVPGAEIVGLPKNAKIEMGSDVLTASGELGLMKSNGDWNWV